MCLRTTHGGSTLPYGTERDETIDEEFRIRTRTRLPASLYRRLRLLFGPCAHTPPLLLFPTSLTLDRDQTHLTSQATPLTWPWPRCSGGEYAEK